LIKTASSENAFERKREATIFDSISI